MRVNINSSDDHIQACCWITVSIILHNLVIDVEGIAGVEHFQPNHPGAQEMADVGDYYDEEDDLEDGGVGLSFLLIMKLGVSHFSQKAITNYLNYIKSYDANYMCNDKCSSSYSPFMISISLLFCISSSSLSKSQSSEAMRLATFMGDEGGVGEERQGFAMYFFSFLYSEREISPASFSQRRS